MTLAGAFLGILLSENVLTSRWFILMASIVGFNTLIYLGLTFAKLVPMPKQIHPSRVRAWLHRLGVNQEARSAMVHIPVPRQPESHDAYEAMRLDISRRDIPQALSLTGGLVVLVSIATALSSAPGSLAFRLAAVGLGVVFLLLAQILGRRRFRAMTMRIVWAVACCLLVAALLVEGVMSGLQLLQLPLSYAVIVMTAFPPVTLSWRVAFGGAAAMFVGLTAVGVVVMHGDVVRPIVLGSSALLVGATLLRLRLVAIDALSKESARSKSLASTDNLTGVLTRQGMLRLLPGLAANAERSGSALCVMYFDIDRLAVANEQYGVQYGDDVVRAVARTIEQQVRRGDLVARWDGDEFLVAGIGSRPDAERMAGRVEEAVRRTGIALGKWPITVAVGTSSGDPRQATFDTLAGEAFRDARERAGRVGRAPALAAARHMAAPRDSAAAPPPVLPAGRHSPPGAFGA